jgi:Kef-type K+ transport system membrane component KefB
MHFLDSLRAALVAAPPVAKLALGMALIVLVPRISRRAGVPAVVGLILAGVVFGPYVLDVFGAQRPIADFFGELGKLLLMFFAGLEINLVLFRQTRMRSLVFGLLTTALPLLLGTAVTLALGYALLPSIVVGSLLASHTLLGRPIVAALGVGQLEPMAVTMGATVISDTLSLIVFAICVPIYASGFSPAGLAVQVVEIVVFVPLVLIAVSTVGARILRRVELEEDTYFIFLMFVLASTAYLAELINLPGIVGAFLAGLAVNATVQDKPATSKLQFIGNSLFIPTFFIATGFLIDPVAFAGSVLEHFPLPAGIIGALLFGKWLAAELAGRAFGYSPAARRTMWSLTLPQVAATLAATLVAVSTLSPAGVPLLDDQMRNAVLVMVLVTSILGPVLTERFGAQLAHPR